jgi:hypothetical protein
MFVCGNDTATVARVAVIEDEMRVLNRTADMARLVFWPERDLSLHAQGDAARGFVEDMIQGNHLIIVTHAPRFVSSARIAIARKEIDPGAVSLVIVGDDASTVHVSFTRGGLPVTSARADILRAEHPDDVVARAMARKAA